LLNCPQGKELNMSVASAAGGVVGKKLFSKSKKIGKAQKKANQPSKLEAIAGGLLTLIMLVIAFAPMLVALRKAFKKDEPKPEGIRTGRDRWTSKMEFEGMEAEGEELVDCAREGLAARAKKKAEKEEAEFDRRVANAMRKAQQGARV